MIPLLFATNLLFSGSPEADGYEPLRRLLGGTSQERRETSARLCESRELSYLPGLVDALFFADSGSRSQVLACLRCLSGQKPGEKHRDWVEWLGAHPEIAPRPGYLAWKAELYGRIDPAFREFFYEGAPARIRPEEIVWGGVRKDGIPPLKDPKILEAPRARYLSDDEEVFGACAGSQCRAYPHRIMDWHEMANDVLGGVPVALSYCTLCGSAILYRTGTPGGGRYVFGSSGFLYRSNKLMYDAGTGTLWSNLTGEPVLGRLAAMANPVRLTILPLVSTSWKQWRTQHPRTTVLDRDTGYSRDYRPGAAYGEYFASPRAMFPVWLKSPALPEKAWVYTLTVGRRAKAFPLESLRKQRVVNDAVGDVTVVLLADPGGAIRAYARGDHFFLPGGGDGEVIDRESRKRFFSDEDRVFSAEAPEATLARLPGHLAYWFAWYAAFPDTEIAGSPD